MRKQIFKIITLIGYCGLLLSILFKYFMYEKQPDLISCLILILLAIFVSEDSIVEKIAKYKFKK